MRKLDLRDKVFGRLTAIRDVGKKNGSRLWECRCSCGNTHTATASQLSYGIVKSCGCTHHEGHRKHGHAIAGRESSTYMIWKAMIQRCHNSNSSAYRYYGARGISVCDRWRTYENFLSDMGEKPQGMSLDRIDNHDGYNLNNCRWRTVQEQANNKRNSRVISALGKTMTMAMWARELGVPVSTLSYAINTIKKEPANAIEYYAQKLNT